MPAATTVYVRYSNRMTAAVCAAGMPRRMNIQPFAGSARKGPVNVSISTASAAKRMRSVSTRPSRDGGRLRQITQPRTTMCTP